jgi:acyl-CoA oxidase
VIIELFNDAKDLFANPKGREHEIIRVFCATKCLASWHAADVGAACRERCGGGGYLAYNKLGEVIFAGHSGMTAEGDNRVLMQKIVKDIISDSMKDRHRAPVMTKCPLR